MSWVGNSSWHSFKFKFKLWFLWIGVPNFKYRNFDFCGYWVQMSWIRNWNLWIGVQKPRIRNSSWPSSKVTVFHVECHSSWPSLKHLQELRIMQVIREPVRSKHCRKTWYCLPSIFKRELQLCSRFLRLIMLLAFILIESIRVLNHT